MKCLIFIFVIFASVACSDTKMEPEPKSDVAEDFAATDMRPTKDVLDLSADFANIPDLPGIHHFPDPNREGGPLCEKSLDCKRFEYCTAFGDCSFGKGCGFLGTPPPFDENVGCIIDENGIGELTGAECQNDDVCPSDMPYCYLRACQKQPRCMVKSDCEDTQICDNDMWCATMPPCDVDDDCGRGGCGEDKICDYDL